MIYLSLVFNLVVVVLFLVIRLVVVPGPEDGAQVAVRDGETHHGQHVGHQEEDNLITVVQQ